MLIYFPICYRYAEALIFLLKKIEGVSHNASFRDKKDERYLEKCTEVSKQYQQSLELSKITQIAMQRRCLSIIYLTGLELHL